MSKRSGKKASIPDFEATLEQEEQRRSEVERGKEVRKEYSARVQAAVEALKQCSWESMPEASRDLGVSRTTAKKRAKKLVETRWRPAVESLAGLVTADQLREVMMPDSTLIVLGRDLFLKMVDAQQSGKDGKLSTEEERCVEGLIAASARFSDDQEALYIFAELFAGEIERLGPMRVLLDPPSWVRPATAVEPRVLTEDQQIFRDIFLEKAPREGLLGPTACERFSDRTGRAIEESDFRTRIVPALKTWGLKNEPKVGYFFPEGCAARMRG